MKPYYEDESVALHHGDCLDVMAAMPAASVDAVVTDPPYLLGFMGRQWDTRAAHEHLEWHSAWAAETFRLLKPGGHLLAFGGSRTWHRLACAIEDAGFELRDSIAWLYGSGFPKSLDVSKAIDRAAGAEREVVGLSNTLRPRASVADAGQTYGRRDDGGESWDYKPVTAPATPAAQHWQGWGTALKPAFEPVVVARKPLAGTVAQNVQEFGTGAINVGACRVSGDVPHTQGGMTSGGIMAGSTGERRAPFVPDTAGRWPTNVVLDEATAADLDQQTGTLTSGSRQAGTYRGLGYMGSDATEYPAVEGDSGGASRFFPTFRYEAKAPTAERPRVGQPDAATLGNVEGGARPEHFRCLTCGRTKSGRNSADGPCICTAPEWEQRGSGTVAHPTVKPLDLMRWLVRLVTPPGGIVLDPFAGSGTTAEACVIEGARCLTIEREAAYLPLIVARLSKPIQPDLFGGVA